MVVIHDSRIEKIMGHGEGVYTVIRIGIIIWVSSVHRIGANA